MTIRHRRPSRFDTFTSLARIAAVIAAIGLTAPLRAQQTAPGPAMAQVRSAAEQGDPAAQYRLGVAYHSGAGVVQDPAEGRRWLQKAAEQSHPGAQFLLGLIYLNGDGVRASDASAANWFAKAAALDHLDAQVLLGAAHYWGQGVSRDYTKALQWWRRAAAAGSPEAQLNLGDAYREGKATTQDNIEAVRWYRRAAAAHQSTALLKLGDMYTAGHGVPQDWSQAIRMYREAAERGNVSAQSTLGVIYSEGKIATADPVQAHMWMNLAAAGASGQTQQEYADTRDHMARSLAPVQLADAQRRARDWSDRQDVLRRLARMPPPPGSEPVRAGGEVPIPARLKDVPPEYLEVAKAARLQGLVIVEVVVDSEGRVVSSKVASKPSPLLDGPAVDAVKQWEYLPTVIGGVAVPVTFTVTVTFRLS